MPICNKSNEDVLLELPGNKDHLIIVCNKIKQGLDKANSKGVFNMSRAKLVKSQLLLLDNLINEIIKTFYVNAEEQTKLLAIPSDKSVLKNMVEILGNAIDDACLKGAYNTVDESSELHDCIVVIMSLVNIVLHSLDKEKEKKNNSSR